MLMSIMLPLGRKFRPASVISRADLAETMVRAGLVPQYMSSQPLFNDVRDNYTRSFVESAQRNPDGIIIFDAAASGNFGPYGNASKLVAAIASSVPQSLIAELRQRRCPLAVLTVRPSRPHFAVYVAVALNKGFLTLDGSNFSPSRGVTRIELAAALAPFAITSQLLLGSRLSFLQIISCSVFCPIMGDHERHERCPGFFSGRGRGLRISCSNGPTRRVRPRGSFR